MCKEPRLDLINRYRCLDSGIVQQTTDICFTAIENIAELGEELISEDLIFSEEGWHDLMVISSEVQKFIHLVIEGLAREDAEIMPYAQKLEDNINEMIHHPNKKKHEK